MTPAAAAQQEHPALDSEAIMALAQQPWTGDLPAMKKRRFIRVLVDYSQTNYFIDAGRARGFEYELMKSYETFLNGKSKFGSRIDLIFVPTPYEDLIAALRDGRGDVIAAGMTITPGRAEHVAFTEPYMPKVNEIVVANKSVTSLRTFDDLSGRRVLVVSGSSYIPHLETLNRDLERRGLTKVTIEVAPVDFEAEDILELVNAGIVEITVVDDHIARIWADILPAIKLYPDIAISRGGRIAWAVRAGSPELRASLNEFVKTHGQGSRIGNILFARYFRNAKWVTDPLSPDKRKKLDEYIALFKKYAVQYDFDWNLIAAQAYQESGLEQRRRSKVGALGLMQIKPSTAGDKNIGIGDVTKAPGNVHAGVKYLAFLRDRYFADPDIDPAARIRFALAAYNAGPGRIHEMRGRAAQEGLDPNQWIGNVEHTTLRHVGRQPVVYVRNISKYFFAYKLADDELRRRAEETEKLKKNAED